MKISILGAGSWGIALAKLLHSNKHAITMWEFNNSEAQLLKENRENKIKLPGILLSEDIIITNNIKKAVTEAELVILVVPSQVLRDTLRFLKTNVESEIISKIQGWIIACKGIEKGSLCLMSQIVEEELKEVGSQQIAVLSGPSHAEETAIGIPTTVVAASTNAALQQIIQDNFSTDTFRIYTNEDIIGVELAGSTKNVIALAAGICDGMKYGDNTKGALLTRGLVEITRLGTAMGAKADTFHGLAGLGDLITTCISRHSRNRTFGEMIGQGMTYKDAMAKMTMVVEGVETAISVHELSKKMKIDMPITTEIYKILFEDKPVDIAVKQLMLRDYTTENNI